MQERELHFEVQGMHCEACVRRVTLALQGVKGLQIEAVRVGSADVKVDEDVTAQAVIAAVARMGFQASVRPQTDLP